MKVAIIYYSTYGHVAVMAKKIKEGIESADVSVQADILQVKETLSEEVLGMLHAPEKLDYPVASTDTLVDYDAFVFGIPTRYGTIPAQWADFWGTTGGLWASGALAGKPAAMFVSTGGAGGGQESTIKNAMSYLVHHGMPYIPLGYSNTFAEMANMDEVHGASAWGSGIFAGSDGSRQPSELELKICHAQGAAFANLASKVVGAKVATATSTSEPAATTNESASKAEEDHTKKDDTEEEPTEKAKEIAQRAKQAAPEAKEEAKGGCMKCTIV